MTQEQSERLESIRALLDSNTGPKFGYTHEVCEAARFLLSLLDSPANEVEQVACDIVQPIRHLLTVNQWVDLMTRIERALGKK